MIGYVLIGAAVALAVVAVWGEHFHSRSWRQGLDRMLGMYRPIIGGGIDHDIQMGDTVELKSDGCDICLHERSAHVPSGSHLMQSKESRCIRKINAFEYCSCRRFAKFRKQSLFGRAIEALYFPFWFG